ncbi:MAG: hypothetical protein JST86_02205 [Bacteroidetes bacterium]|nr:hypothetical protein [Bacteroidota bacterium]
MKKPALLFALKCSVIIYFAACSSIDKLSVSDSISHQLVSRTAWKVNCYDKASSDNTCIFEGYTFNFDASGKVVAAKNGKTIEGNWLEDNISKKITLHFNGANAELMQLNNYWDISNISEAGITFEKETDKSSEKLYITSL